MPRWDFKCPACGSEREVLCRSFAELEFTVVLCNCGLNKGTKSLGTPMKRQPAAPSFSVKGYSAANGYSNK